MRSAAGRAWQAGGERRSDEALRRLVAMIFEGRLSPGARLPPERELAAGLQISRATLRDAINRLAARGYVECRAKSGDYVCSALPGKVREPIEEILEAHLAELSHIIEIRKVLEIWIAGKVAGDAEAGIVAGLGDCLRRMRANSRLRSDAEFARYREADVGFHSVLARGTGNPICAHLMSYLYHLISRSIAISRGLMAGSYGERNLRTHENILAAIRAADAAAAEQAMKEHFEIIERSMPARRRGRRRASPRGTRQDGGL